LEIALAADVRIAADDASFGFPEMTLGAYPGGGGAVLLPRLIGRQRALEWLYSTRRLTAVEARELGLVVSVVPRAELLQKAREQAGAVAACAPLAVAALKRSINASAEMPLSKAFEWDQLQRRPLDATQDYEEGLKAFREKRPPVFRGV
jgi:enoyl-CoA hydratase/carnithine racemase